MIHIINGREYEIPTSDDGSVPAEAIRRAAGIPSDRPIILKGRDGANRVVNPGEKLLIDSRQHFSDMPAHRRGSRA